jgi:hypothetical protein
MFWTRSLSQLSGIDVTNDVTAQRIYTHNYRQLSIIREWINCGSPPPPDLRCPTKNLHTLVN